MTLFRKKQPVPMEAWHDLYDMTGVAVHPSNAAEGSPKTGDWIAWDPNHIIDRWLVTAEYHAATYEEVQ